MGNTGASALVGVGSGYSPHRNHQIFHVPIVSATQNRFFPLVGIAAFRVRPVGKRPFVVGLLALIQPPPQIALARVIRLFLIEEKNGREGYVPFPYFAMIRFIGQSEKVLYFIYETREKISR